MSNSRLISGRVLKKTGADLEQSRYEFLDLASAEPDLGQPNFDGAVLISDADGSRYWTDNIRIDLTGNIYVGTISNADGSSAIRLVDNVLMEDNLVVNGLTTAPDLFTSRISSPDSSAITFIPAVILNSDLTVDGDAVITGNLTVQGTTTTINSTQLSVEDKNIELANGAGTAAEADGAGITVNGPAVAASLIYTASDDTWNFNKTLKSNVVGDVTGNITGSVFTTEIDSPDSSAISVIPAVIFNSDVIVENEIQGNLVGQVSDISNHSIGDLSDVDLDILPLDNQTLVWDSAQGKFVPGDSFSQTDFDTAFGTKSVGDLSDVDLTSNAPTEGQTLVWDSAEGKFVPGRALGSSDSVDFDTVIANIVTNSIDSADSSEIVITPSVRVLSDLTVENDLTVSNEVSAEKFVGYLDGSARDIDDTAITNKEFATELDANLDQVFVYDVSAGQLKKTYLSEIVSQGSNGFTGSQGDQGFVGSQGDLGYAGSQGDLGYTGSAGFTGSFGFTGSQGEKGYTGSSGLDGYTGSKGNDGTSVKIVGVVATANDLPDPYGGDIGDGYIVTDTGNLWTWSGSAWIEAGRVLGYTGSQGPAGGYTGSKGDPGVAASFTTRAYTGDGSTTEFEITAGNTIQTVLVFLNGVNQRPTDDYTVTGSTLSFTTAPSTGELIIIREMPQAATGYTGSIGYTGSQGEGFTGSQGELGYTGSQGELGFTGSQGEQGTPGSSVTIVGSVDDDTLLPLPYNGNIGDGYITRDDGRLHVWDGVEWDDVGQVQGFTGSQGDTGFTGSEGDIGPIGYTGSAGSGGGGGAGSSYISLVMTGTITTPFVGTSRFYPPKDLSITVVYASVTFATTAGAFTFVLKKNGVDLGTTFSIAQGQNIMTPVSVNTTLLTTDYLTLDVTGASATDLFVKIEYINT